MDDTTTKFIGLTTPGGSVAHHDSKCTMFIGIIPQSLDLSQCGGTKPCGQRHLSGAIHRPPFIHRFAHNATCKHQKHISHVHCTRVAKMYSSYHVARFRYSHVYQLTVTMIVFAERIFQLKNRSIAEQQNTVFKRTQSLSNACFSIIFISLVSHGSYVSSLKLVLCR